MLRVGNLTALTSPLEYPHIFTGQLNDTLGNKGLNDLSFFASTPTAGKKGSLTLRLALRAI